MRGAYSIPTGILSLHRLALRNGFTSDDGTGIYSLGTLLAVDCTITKNNTPSLGGGLVVTAGVAKLHRCTISNNTAGDAGGIWQQGTTSRSALTHCTVAGNRSTGGFTTGAIVSGVGTMDLRHCTITQNEGNGAGGGVFLHAPGSVRVERCIIAGNRDTSDRPDIYFFANGPVLTATGPSLIGNNTSVTTQFPAGPLAGTAAAPLAPLLSPLAPRGGPTETMPPLPGSPALEAAVDSTALTDQRGFFRNRSGARRLPIAPLPATA